MHKINDIGLVASLYSLGFMPAKKVVEEGLVYFVFPDTEIISGAISLYNSGNLQVNAKINNTWYRTLVREAKKILDEATNDDDKKKKPDNSRVN
jgi:hypothetical protein